MTEISNMQSMRRRHSSLVSDDQQCDENAHGDQTDQNNDDRAEHNQQTFASARKARSDSRLHLVEILKRTIFIERANRSDWTDLFLHCCFEFISPNE